MTKIERRGYCNYNIFMIRFKYIIKTRRNEYE